MNYSIILFITFFHLYLNQTYQLRHYNFIIFGLNHNLAIYYHNFYQQDIYYSGWSEYINNSIPIEKEKSHELVFLLGENNINDIETFPETTIFIISKDFANKLENKHRKYKIFLIDVDKSSASYFFRESIFCLIGKKLDKNILRVLKIFVYSSIIILFIIFSLNIIMTIIISEENRLPIHTLITIFSFFLIGIILLNGFNFILDSVSYSIAFFDFMNLSLYSSFKGFYYSEMFFSLSGNMILNFNENVKIFEKIRNPVVICSLFLTIVFKVFTYFFNCITELKLLYIKNILEHSILLIFTIYYIDKNLLALYQQMKYEQRIHSELVPCLKFKFQRMFWLNVFMIIYNIFFIVSTSIEHDYIFSYIDNIKIHISMNLFYEAVFFIFFFIIFFPLKLPRYYHDKVIFNYENTNILLVDIPKTRNISILTSNILKKSTNLPIVFYNPYISSKNQFSSKGIHIGIIQK